MFLVRGDIYHEDVWTAWIGDLADLVPPSLFCDEVLAQCYRDMPQRQVIRKSVYDRQVYFSIVVHTKPNYPGYNEGSIFDNRIVQERVEVRVSRPETCCRNPQNFCARYCRVSIIL